MAGRTKRGNVKTHKILPKLADGRYAAIQVCSEAKINSKEYQSARELSTAIDNLAEILTGDLTYFHLKAQGGLYEVGTGVRSKNQNILSSDWL